jgi:single-strand DNA-binding protein
MARSINQITLVGYMGDDPEVRHTKKGNKVTQFVVATSRRWTKADGTEQSKTEWHRCVAWNGGSGPPFADIAEQYGRKGLRCFIAGRLEYRKYTDRNSKERWVTEIVVQEFLALDRGDTATRAPERYQSASAN